MNSVRVTSAWPLALPALVLCASPLFAQPDTQAETITPLVTDRPDFTESADSVDPGRVQLEAGYTREKSGDEEVDSLGELLLRIGLTRALELRLAPSSYLREISTPGPDSNGFEDPSVGLKWEIGEGEEISSLLTPATALIISTTLPVGASEVSDEKALPAVILALDWTLDGPTGLASNIGLAAEADTDDDRYAVGIASLAAGRDLGDAWGGYLEYYALVPEGSDRDTQHFLNAGLTYLVSVDFQLDIRVGTELSGETDYFAGVGLAYRW